MMYEFDEEKKDLVPDYEETEFDMEEEGEAKSLSTGAAVAIGAAGALLGILVIKGVAKGVKKVVKIVRAAMAEEDASASNQTEDGSAEEATKAKIVDAAE